MCTACPLLCADIDLPAAVRACDHGRRMLTASPGGVARPLDHGRPLEASAALRAAATVLAAARRVLVTGLGEVSLDAATRAADMAEQLVAAIDGGDPAMALRSGPTVARSGAVTADFDDLRSRADVVVVWGCDPPATHPRFFERFLPPRARVFHVGRSPARGLPAGHVAIALEPHERVAALRRLTALARGPVAPLPDDALGHALAPLVAAVGGADCLGIVTGEPEGSDGGVGAWAVAEWVRAEALRRPAFEVPLPGGVGTASGGAAGTAALLTWRYGGPGAIARADRAGGGFRPAEAAAALLLDRGEVDAVLVVGRPRPEVAAALTRAGDRVAVVTVAPDPVVPWEIFVPVTDPLDDPGEWLRADGVAVTIPGRHPAREGARLASVLGQLGAALAAKLREARR